MQSLVALNALLSATALAVVCGCTAYRHYRECGIHGCPADAKITSEVSSLVAEHPELRTRVYVQTWDNVVYLSGRVTTDMQRDLADSIAHEPSGVRIVVDNVTVAADSGS